MTEPACNIRTLCDRHAPRPDPRLHGRRLGSFVGHHVKIGLIDRTNPTLNEHLWVKVTAIKDGELVGIIDSDVVLDVGYRLGDRIQFVVTEVEEFLQQ